MPEILLAADKIMKKYRKFKKQNKEMEKMERLDINKIKISSCDS